MKIGRIKARIKEEYSRRGIPGVSAAVMTALHARTLGKIDLLLFYDLKWSVIKRWMLRPFFHRTARRLGLTEAEHQIGRLMNMRSALAEMRDSGLKGDIVEFGSYQGFSLWWLSRFRDELGIKARVIGIDSFEGLPENSTIWRRGLFSDTSRQTCEKAILKACGSDSLKELDIHIVQGLFDDPRVEKELRALAPRIALAHIDCDLGSSCSRALRLLRPDIPGGLYLLFDDWYWHPEEIPASFSSFLDGLQEKPAVTELSSTRYTLYVRLGGKEADG
ncbi:MAG: TylF/MycF/NovP-related O-methyltransferase [Elusimicrobiales bacterium]|nr:TylF/MycF/NovP-related O-methyltransferase [Elusimicrobiales bacterium]